MRAVLRFDISGSCSEPVVKVMGEFDIGGEEAFATAVEGVLPDAQAVTIDMTETTFVDSTGVRALLAAHNRTTDAGVKLWLVQGAAVKRVFELLGITDTFNYVEPEEGSPPQ
jgi:anti-sigma B factor antagonist